MRLSRGSSHERKACGGGESRGDAKGVWGGKDGIFVVVVAGGYEDEDEYKDGSVYGQKKLKKKK